MANDDKHTNPNIYSSASGLDGYALVTGSTAAVSRLLGFVAENASSSNCWVQLFDSNVAPTNGATPILSAQCLAGQQINLDVSSFGDILVQNGICIALSTTRSTYTAAGAHMFLTAFWLPRV